MRSTITHHFLTRCARPSRPAAIGNFATSMSAAAMYDCRIMAHFEQDDMKVFFVG